MDNTTDRPAPQDHDTSNPQRKWFEKLEFRDRRDLERSLEEYVLSGLLGMMTENGHHV